MRSNASKKSRQYCRLIRRVTRCGVRAFGREDAQDTHSICMRNGSLRMALASVYTPCVFMRCSAMRGGAHPDALLTPPRQDRQSMRLPGQLQGARALACQGWRATMRALSG